MCNLYRLNKAKAEIANWFAVDDGSQGANFGEEVYPGYPGAVIADGQMRQMSWGFPLVLKGKGGKSLKPKPVNNARSDKFGSFFWRSSFEKRRCLIPLTGWAEAEGPKGGKTRTWLSLADAELFACAGVWRKTDEWGDCYAMVMTDSAGAARDVHRRMPVILDPAEYSDWITGTADDAYGLCRAWPGDIVLDRTTEAWVRGGQSRLL